MLICFFFFGGRHKLIDFIGKEGMIAGDRDLWVERRHQL